MIFFSRKILALLTAALWFLSVSVSFAATTYMVNTLPTTGQNQPNPAYNRQIKNIMIFQVAGWSGLPDQEDQGIADPTWPLGGRQAYLSKTKTQYIEQMQQIRTMNLDTAVAVLLMPDEEAAGSGYGACWSNSPAYSNLWLGGKSCASPGTWQRPKRLFQELRNAAWMIGVQVAPFFSINNYDCLGCPNMGSKILPKLQSYVNWYKANFNDAVALRNSEGKFVILIEGIPQNTQMTSAQRLALINYMNSQTDILWIDNLSHATPAQAGANVYFSPAVDDLSGVTQDGIRAQWGSKFLWHFLNRFGKFEADMSNPAFKVPETVRMKWLNIDPPLNTPYPVIISQWNEYAEFLVFEPNLYEGYNEYNYLQWRLSQQP